MNKIGLLLICTALVAGCSKNPSNQGSADVGDHADVSTTPDTGSDASVPEPDAALPDTSTADAEADQGSQSGCLQVTAAADFRDAYADDVSIEYDVNLTPEIDGQSRRLALLFERYGDAQYTGTFELGTGADANFGTCAHCLFIRGNSPERAWFADRGTLVSDTNPFGRRVDFEVTNLRLIEVAVDLETRTSAPLPDGSCIEVADFTTAGAHPPSEWICDDDKYDDGVACSCACGTFDPDCDTGGCLPEDPGCIPGPPEPLPIEGCQAKEVCSFDPVAGAPGCAITCDWKARQGCDDGTCVFDRGVGNEGDLCITQAERIAADVAVGEPCPGSFYAQVCAINNGFAEGYCGPNNVCRSLCETNADCTDPTHTCRPVSADQTIGYCGPEPTDG